MFCRACGFDKVQIMVPVVIDLENKNKCSIKENVDWYVECEKCKSWNIDISIDESNCIEEKIQKLTNSELSILGRN